MQFVAEVSELSLKQVEKLYIQFDKEAKASNNPETQPTKNSRKKL